MRKTNSSDSWYHRDVDSQDCEGWLRNNEKVFVSPNLHSRLFCNKNHFPTFHISMYNVFYIYLYKYEMIYIYIYTPYMKILNINIYLVYIIT